MVSLRKVKQKAKGALEITKPGSWVRSLALANLQNLNILYFFRTAVSEQKLLVQVLKVTLVGDVLSGAYPTISIHLRLLLGPIPTPELAGVMFFLFCFARTLLKQTLADPGRLRRTPGDSRRFLTSSEDSRRYQTISKRFRIMLGGPTFRSRNGVESGFLPTLPR